MYGLQIQKLISKKQTLTDPEDRIKLLQQAISISDAHHDVEWSVDLRLDLMHEELDTPHDHLSYEAISWIIGAYEQNPDIIDEKEFLWPYKWAFRAVVDNPNLSKAQVQRVLEDFSKRLQRNDYSLRSIYYDFLDFYTYLGLKEKATEFKNLKDQQSRDSLSDCEACELDSDVTYLLNFEDIDKAISEATDILNGKLTCNRIPLSTLAKLTFHLTRLNRLDQAKTYFEKGIDIIYKEEVEGVNFREFLNLAYYLSKINSLETWSLIEKYYYQQLPSEFLQYKIALGMLAILKSTPTQNIEVKLPDWISIRNETNVYTKQELYEYYYQQAKVIGAKMAHREEINEISLHLDKSLSSF